MIQAVIFDWGGVLGKDGNDIAAASLSEKYNLDKDDVYDAIDSLEDQYSASDENDEYYVIVASRYPFSPEEVRAALEPIVLNDTFEYARGLAVKKYILSNQMKPRTDSIKREVDLSFFEETFFSNEIGFVKPDVRAFELVLENIGLAAEDCVFVDDRQANIDAATSLGMHGILYTGLADLKQELTKLI